MTARATTTRQLVAIGMTWGVASAEPAPAHGEDAVLQRALPKLTACYEAAAKYAPDLPASQAVTIALQLDARGTPGDVRVEPASRCMTDVVKTLRWPRGKARALSLAVTVRDARSAEDRAAGRPADAPPKDSGYGVSSARRTVPGPAMTIGMPRVTGSLEAKIVRRHVRRASARLVYCYEKQLLATPKLAGSVRLALAIAEDGRVASATATGLGDDAVEACIQREVLMTKFPGGPAEATLAITLRPR